VADICIIYVREDAKKAAAFLQRFLKQQWSVWRDVNIVKGDFRKEIKRQISIAGCIIPIWSEKAEFNRWLHDELAAADKNNVPILPVRIHNVDAPMGYGNLQADEAIGWSADSVTPEIANLSNRIQQTLAERKEPSKHRLQMMATRRPTSLPAFFFSVSSHETRLTPGAALDALDLFEARPILISAYDMAKGRRTRGTFPKLREMQRKGATILLDSGNYEKARREDPSWSRNKYYEAVAETPHDLAFHYDDLQPSKQYKKLLGEIIHAVELDTKRTKKQILPIVHLPKTAAGHHDINMAPKLMLDVARELKPPLIAIPERELGASVFERVATMRAIRLELHDLHFYQPIHILGAGNPLAVSLLAAAGADSFDGLEWCRYVIDEMTKTLHHFQHYELFKYQDKLNASSVTQQAAVSDDVPYTGKAIFHNLGIYGTWFDQLRNAVADDRRLMLYLADIVPQNARPMAKDVLPELFP